MTARSDKLGGLKLMETLALFKLLKLSWVLTAKGGGVRHFLLAIKKRVADIAILWHNDLPWCWVTLYV